MLPMYALNLQGYKVVGFQVDSLAWEQKIQLIVVTTVLDETCISNEAEYRTKLLRIVCWLSKRSDQFSAPSLKLCLCF